MHNFYNLTQGKQRNNQEYYDDFNSMVLTAEESGATIGAHPGSYNNIILNSANDPLNPTDDERTAGIKKATERYLAVAFLLGADRIQYGTLIEEMENEFLRNKGDSSESGTYPTTVAEAHGYLCNYKKDPKILSRLLGQSSNSDYNTGVAFAQDRDRQDHGNGTNNQKNSQEQTFTTSGGGSFGYKKTCRRCGADGHTSIDCNSTQEKVEIFRQTSQPNQGVSQLIKAVDWDGIVDTPDEALNWTFLLPGVVHKTRFKSDGPIQCTEYNKDGTISRVHKSTIFSQANNGIPKTWYLLDTQLTCDIVSNPELVTNIRQVEGYMQLATQAGSIATNWMANVPGYYRPVWFHPGGIANILCLVNMIARYHVTYYSCHGESPNTFCVHKEDGEQRRFQQSKRGLYYLDIATTTNHTVLAVSTVEHNKSNYTDRDYSRAVLARKVQILAGYPELLDYINENAIPNCLINMQDAINAHAIFGCSLGAIQGKTTGLL
jgi:hypothetical protein